MVGAKIMVVGNGKETISVCVLKIGLVRFAKRFDLDCEKKKRNQRCSLEFWPEKRGDTLLR